MYIYNSVRCILLLLNHFGCLQTMNLGRDPYPTEVDELVNKEIAAVILKNEEKKGKDKTTDLPGIVSNDVEVRLLFLKDKWAGKLEIWERMMSDSQEGDLNESGTGTAGGLRGHGRSSQKLPSKVCVPSKDSAN